MERINGCEFISDFYLAGGTALALLIGHRQSIDFDFFSNTKFSNLKILDSLNEILKDDEQIEIKEQDKDTLILFINNVKLSFFFYSHKLLGEKITILNNINLASLKDILAMKLIAISQRGTKKDFIDMYFLLKNNFSLSNAVNVLNEKYDKIKFNKLHILKSLTYFDDANMDANPKMLKDVSWKEVKESIEKDVNNYLKNLVE